MLTNICGWVDAVDVKFMVAKEKNISVAGMIASRLGKTCGGNLWFAIRWLLRGEYDSSYNIYAPGSS